jgi:hypothetical protein
MKGQYMHDSDTQLALDRIEERNQWVLGWIVCATVSILAFAMIALDWAHRTRMGKFAAVSFILFLVVYPTAIAIRRRMRKAVTPGWVLLSGYILLMLALQAFGPLTYAR